MEVKEKNLKEVESDVAALTRRIQLMEEEAKKSDENLAGIIQLVTWRVTWQRSQIASSSWWKETKVTDGNLEVDNMRLTFCKLRKKTAQAFYFLFLFTCIPPPPPVVRGDGDARDFTKPWQP
jgi:hypothetical protein